MKMGGGGGGGGEGERGGQVNKYPLDSSYLSPVYPLICYFGGHTALHVHKLHLVIVSLVLSSS